MQNFAFTISTPYDQAAINARKNFNASEKLIFEKLGMIVNGSIKAISVMNNIKENNVVAILGKVHVATLDEVQEAVEHIEDIEVIDVARLAVGIEETIKAIADMTHLEVGEITGTFARKNSVSVEDIVNRLYEESKTGLLLP